MVILQARILEWVAFPFSRVSAQPRDRTQVSHTAGELFTVWVIRGAHEYWRGKPVLSPGDLLEPEILNCRWILYQLSYKGSSFIHLLNY